MTCKHIMSALTVANSDVTRAPSQYVREWVLKHAWRILCKENGREKVVKTSETFALSWLSPAKYQKLFRTDIRSYKCLKIAPVVHNNFFFTFWSNTDRIVTWDHLPKKICKKMRRGRFFACRRAVERQSNGHRYPYEYFVESLVRINFLLLLAH